MTIHSVYDPAFKPYGKVLEGFDTAVLLREMETIPLPKTGTSYQTSIGALETVPIYQELKDRAFGGMPIELGMCWGRNTKLNCLEYHRDSEINIGSEDFILLLAKLDEIENSVLDTGKVKAFRVPKGAVVEIYATTLHYAPCHADPEKGFRSAVALPYGTNCDYTLAKIVSHEDRMLRAKNKWLLSHPDAPEAEQGAYIGLTGTNIDLEAEL